MLKDKSEWPPGPWHNEPDSEQWLDKTTGFFCLIVRIPESGHLCGYVQIPKTHPLYTASIDTVNEIVRVHGGVTWLGPIDKRIGYWIGFDCIHGGDLAPAYFTSDGDRGPFCGPNDTYKDWNYVKKECEKMAVNLLPENILEGKILGY